MFRNVNFPDIKTDLIYKRSVFLEVYRILLRVIGYECLYYLYSPFPLFCGKKLS